MYAVVLSDSNELNELNKLYKSTELSNKSTESGMRAAKDKHDHTSPSAEFSCVEELLGIKNSVISNKLSRPAGSSSTNSSPNVNDENERSHTDPGHCMINRMINERNGKIKSHRIMSPEFARRKTYKRTGFAGSSSDSSSDCLSAKSTSRSTSRSASRSASQSAYSSTSSTCSPPADCSLSSSNCSSSNWLMDLLAKQPTGKMKLSAFNSALLLTACLLICGPTSASAGRCLDYSCKTELQSFIKNLNRRFTSTITTVVVGLLVVVSYSRRLSRALKRVRSF